MSAITAVGAYAPRFRIAAEAFEDAWGQFHAAGVTEKAVPGADEDPLTIAYEAAVRALEAADLDGEDVAWIGFATSNPPLEEEDLTARLSAMLALRNDATCHLFTGSTRAGTRALWACMDAITAVSGPGLVVAADAPRGDPDDVIDHAAGAGGAAFVLEHDGPADLVDRAEYTTPYPGTRFRQHGETSVDGLGTTQYDRQAFTESISGAVDGLETVLDPDAAAIQAPDGKLPYRAATAAGVGTDEIRACATVHELGDLGAASVPVGLARALADDYESILAVSHGSGAAADALVVESADAVPANLELGADDSLSYTEYLRQRGVVTSDPPSGGGAYVSVPSWRRSLPQRYRLVAGRCVECDEIAFPPDGACDVCGTLADYETVELDGKGTIEGVTTISQGGAPPEFAEQQAKAGDYAAAIIALDADGEDTVSVPAMGTDADPSTFAVGDRVEMTMRRIYTQEGVTRYGFKFRPSGGK